MCGVDAFYGQITKGELRAGIHIHGACINELCSQRSAGFLGVFFTSGLKEFIKCCTILGLLVYMSYKQYEPYNKVFFSAIGYAHRQHRHSKTQTVDRTVT